VVSFPSILSDIPLLCNTISTYKLSVQLQTSYFTLCLNQRSNNVSLFIYRLKLYETCSSIYIRGKLLRHKSQYKRTTLCPLDLYVEYASNVKSPHKIMHLNSYERYNFTQRNTELRDFSYRERLGMLYLDNLIHKKLDNRF